MKQESLSPKARAVLGRMTEEEWKDLTNRLLYFAHRSYGMYSRRELPDELVQEAILDLLTGVRRWPPVDSYGQEKEVSLFIFLCYTIRSKASHVFERWRRESHVDQFASDRVSSNWLGELSVESEARYHELAEQLIKIVSDDTVLTRMVRLWVETPDLRPKEIALRLGVSMEELRNAKKRLNRRVKMLREDKNTE